jgi:hypothetical protein
MNFEKAVEIVAAGGACARPSWKGEILVGANRVRLFRDQDTGKEREYKLGDQGYLRRFYPKNHPKYPAGGVDLYFDLEDYRADAEASDWVDVTDIVKGKKSLGEMAVAAPEPKA